MSVINRIEVANLLNKHGDVTSPWEPKMRHLLLNLRGQSTAISMENGFGKTTLSDALIGMLSRDRKLMSNTRKKMSPSRGELPWSHLRVEFRTKSGRSVAQDDLLAQAGSEVDGEAWVFGMFGHCDTDVHFYYYPGRLEECPIKENTRDGKLYIYPNQHFQSSLRQYKRVVRPGTRDEWLEAISQHISRKELEQLASFQKEGGADKSQIFNAIRPRAGEKPDQAFFYEVLAPQILAGATQGETDEGEEFIEDVVINSGQKVSELRHRLLEAEKDLSRTQRKVEALDGLNRQAAELRDSRARLQVLQQQLETSAHCLQTLAARPLPGIPAGPAEADALARLAQGFALLPGHTEPLVASTTLAVLLNSTPAKVQAYFDSAGLSGNRTRRLLHHPQASWVQDKKIVCYPIDKARDLLAQSRSFEDDSQRLKALELLDEAQERFLDWDSNHCREHFLADQTYKHSLQTELTETEQRLEQTLQLKDSLESRNKEFTDNQTYYQDALAQGLFSEAELEQPDATEQAVKQAADAARQALSEHQRKVGQLQEVATEWQHFQQAHPDVTPALLLEEKQARWDALSDQLEQLQDTYQRSRQALERTRAQRDAQQQALNRLQPELQQLTANRPAHTQFQQLHPAADPIGFLQQLQQQVQAQSEQERSLQRQLDQAELMLKQLQPLAVARDHFIQLHGDITPVGLRDQLLAQDRQLQEQRARQQQQLASLSELALALERFRERVGDPSPAQWLEHAQTRYPQVLTELEHTAQEIERIQRRLQRLDTDPLAESAQEQRAHTLLAAQQLPARPLHQALNELLPEAAQATRRRWLTQAAAFLFAPVLENAQQAEQAAKLLLQRNLALPVFAADTLQAALQQGHPLLGAAIGHETLAVKAALDPSHIEQLREQLQQQLAELEQQQTALRQECEQLDPYGACHRLAEQARQALAERVDTQLPALEQALTRTEQELAALQPKLTPEALNLIQDYQHFLELGGDVELSETRASQQALTEQLAALQPKLQQLRDQLNHHQRLYLAAEDFALAGGEERFVELTQQVAELTLELEALEETLAQHQQAVDQHHDQLERLRREQQSIFGEDEKRRLERLARYLANGEHEFMATAQAREQDLLQAQEQASRRANWNFQRIRDYLAVRDDKGGQQQLEKELAKAKQQIHLLREQVQLQRRQLSQLDQQIEHNRRGMALLDELALEWLEQLRELSGAMLEQVAQRYAQADPEILEALPLYEETLHFIDLCRQDEPDIAALEPLQAQLVERLREERINERGKELTRQEKLVTQQGHTLRQALAQALAQSNLFNATEQARLGALERLDEPALNDLRQLATTLREQLDTHQQRVEQLKDSQQQVEAGLQERLSRIIADAAGNLQILKRVARQSSSDNGAHFDIQANVIDEQGIQQLVAALLGEIEEHHALLRRRIEQNREVGSEEKQRRDLQELIRRRIYRTLFTHISIRLRHEAIRPHGRLFSLNEQMSEGQREAVSLMWLVKLSEFAIERDLRNFASHQKKRERASRESVIILDGLFSKLSHKKLIEDSLESLRNTRGRFQMIGLIHNPNYENDPGIFPTYLVGSVIGGRNGQGGHVIVREGKIDPAANAERAGEASLFQLNIRQPVAESQ